MKTRINLLFTTLFFLLLSQYTYAELFISQANGDFNNPDTWNIGAGKIPGEMDDVLIQHFITLDLNTKTTINSMALHNGVPDSVGLLVHGTDSLVVIENIEAFSEGGYGHLFLFLKDSVTLIANGNVNFKRNLSNTSNKILTFALLDYTRAYINGDFNFNYYNAGHENVKEVILGDYALLDVTGKTKFKISAGEDFNLGLYNQSQVIFRDSLKLELTGTGKEAGITLHDSSYLAVYSSAYIHNSSTESNDFAKIRVRDVYSKVYIQNNITLDSDGAMVKIEAEGTASEISIDGDIIMNAGAQQEAFINIVDGGQVKLGGTISRLTDYGNLTMAGQGKLVFNGTSPQSIPVSKLPSSGTDSLYFMNVEFDNTSGAPITLTEDMIIQDSLVLDNGKVITSASAKIVLEDGATITGGNSNSYIIGPVRKLGTSAGQSLTIPIGSNEEFAPITLSPISNTNADITFRYASEPPPFDIDTKQIGIDNISTDGYWTVEKNASAGNLGVTLNWENSAEKGITEINDLLVVGWDGTEWKNFGQEESGIVGDGGYVRSLASEPPPFDIETITLGSSSSLNALPVELNNFEVAPHGDKVIINWQTTSEINTSHFAVERSTNGVDFDLVKYTRSHGGINTTANYQLEDSNPFFGWNYYRLKMIDLDGSYEYSAVEAIKFKANTSIIAYPNPVRDVLFLQDTEWIESAVKVEIFNRNAVRIYEEDISLDGGHLQLNINQINEFPSGYYIVKITGSKGSKYTSFITAE